MLAWCEFHREGNESSGEERTDLSCFNWTLFMLSMRDLLEKGSFLFSYDSIEKVFCETGLLLVMLR